MKVADGGVAIFSAVIIWMIVPFAIAKITKVGEAERKVVDFAMINILVAETVLSFRNTCNDVNCDIGGLSYI
ncbi:hypothetical protein IMAU30005_01852 [Lactobacillus helveticus]|nr:hypothetical protein [Lactobacillus helveticus]